MRLASLQPTSEQVYSGISAHSFFLRSPRGIPVLRVFGETLIVRVPEEEQVFFFPRPGFPRAFSLSPLCIYHFPCTTRIYTWWDCNKTANRDKIIIILSLSHQTFLCVPTNDVFGCDTGKRTETQLK